MRDAWETWKDIAYPGRVVVPGPKGKVHVYDFTRRDMKLLEQSGNAKVADGWNVPVCWEHQDVQPVHGAELQLSHNAEAQMALGVFARIKRFARTPDGRLKALLAGPDPKDRQQLEKVGFVSPEIVWNWRDTDGKLWRGPSVTHLAATPRPVQRHQHPVGADPDAPHPALRANSLESLVRLSLARPGNGPRVGARLRLSLDHYAAKPGGAKHMPEENTDTPGGTEKKLTPWEKIAAALAEHCGIDLGDVSKVNDPDTFAMIVDVAARNYKAGSEPAVEDEDDDEGDETEDPNAPPEGDMEQPPEGASEPSAPPVQMSITAATKPLADKLIATARAALVARAEKVRKSGALAPKAADALVEECRTVRLSLAATGDVIPNDTTKALARYEQVRAGAAVNLGAPRSKAAAKPAKGKKARLSLPANVREEEDSPYREDPKQDTDAIVDAWDRT